MRPPRIPLVFILALQASLLCAPVYSFCGFYAGKADATLLNTASQVVVVRDGNRTVLSMLNNYQGALSEFALIVPTPVVLQRGQVRVAEKTVFEHLDAYSSPRLVEYYDSDPCRAEFSWGQNLDPPYPSTVAPISAMPMVEATTPMGSRSGCEKMATRSPQERVPILPRSQPGPGQGDAG